MMRQLGPAIALLLAATPLSAAEAPAPGHVDARIRSIDYNADQVVQIVGYPTYQMMIQFAPDERIENVALGDSASWQVTPNRKANLLFIKPTVGGEHTNMAVVTDRRAYNFDLISKQKYEVTSSELIFALRFRYAEPAPDPLADEARAAERPPVWNLSYVFKGSKANRPARIYDDGRSTYFQWRDDTSTPAIFVVGPDKSEALVNTTVRGLTTVVDTVGAEFVLRHGKHVTFVFNQGLAAKPGVAAAPVAAKVE